MRRLLSLYRGFRVWLAAQLQQIAAIKRPDPVEVVAIAIPVLAEAVVVTAFIGMIVVWIAIANTPAVTG